MQEKEFLEVGVLEEHIMFLKGVEEKTNYLNVWHLSKIQEFRCKALLWFLVAR